MDAYCIILFNALLLLIRPCALLLLVQWSSSLVLDFCFLLFSFWTSLLVVKRLMVGCIKQFGIRYGMWREYRASWNHPLRLRKTLYDRLELMKSQRIWRPWNSKSKSTGRYNELNANSHARPFNCHHKHTNDIVVCMRSPKGSRRCRTDCEISFWEKTSNYLESNVGCVRTHANPMDVHEKTYRLKFL